MKQILLFLAMQLIVVSAYSQTEIPGGELTTTTWTASGSPYNINGNITIPSDSTLTVDPGVEIIFKGDYRLTIKGILIAQGTTDSEVTFTADSKWGGIYVSESNVSTDSIILDYCTISKSVYCGIWVDFFDRIRISNCHIDNNSYSSGRGGGIYLEGSNAVIRNNLIENNSAKDGGGIYSYKGSPKITNNTFKSNTATGGGGGLDLRYAKTTVANNLFIGNYANVRGGAIYSVYNTNGYQVLYINNTIINNTSGSGAGIFSWESADKYVNNVIWGNSGGQFAYTKYRPILHHNAIEGELSINYDGVVLSSTNDASEGPMFTDPGNNDFTLQASSPLIDAGTPRGTTIGYTENAPETYYTITSRTNNSNAGTVWPKYEFVIPDDSAVFCIGLNEHYELTSATYNDVDVTSELDTDGDTIFYTARNISQNGAFVIVFSQVLYDVTVSAGANGSITPSTPSTGGIESSLEYTIQPDPGYVTDTFTINGVDYLSDLIKSGTSYSYLLDTITEDKNINAGFAYGSFTISTIVGNNGNITPSADSVVQYHDETVYTIDPDQYYTLSEVLVNNESVMFDTVGASYQVTIDSVVIDTDLEVIFEPIQYMITKTAVEGGFIYPNDTTYVTFFDSTVFSILPEPGYLFDSLYLDDMDITHLVTEHNGNLFFGFDSISEDKLLKPVFALDTFTISVEVALNGTITPNIDSIVTVKDVVNYIITPDGDYTIDTLFVNNIDYTNKLVDEGDYFTFELTEVAEDVTIRVVFGLKTFIISTDAGIGGTITPINGTEILIYDSAVFEITPDLAYLVSEATLDGEDIKSLIPNTGGIYTIDSVQKDMLLSVSFVPDTFTVTPTYSGCGTISPAQAYKTTINDKIIFQLFPGENCSFQVLLNGEDITGWVDDDAGSLNLELSNVTEDIDIEFIFTEITSVDDNTLSDLNVYPIPCTDNLTIDLKEGTMPFSINVINIVGNSVMTQESFNGAELNVSSLPKGVYFLIINQDGKKYVNKFIKK